MEQFQQLSWATFSPGTVCIELSNVLGVDMADIAELELHCELSEVRRSGSSISLDSDDRFD